MIGRKSEQETLLRVKDSTRSEFVAVYGRRRVGKTYLVRQTFASELTFAHSGLENIGLSGQLRAFRSSLAESGLAEIPYLETWFDAFDALKQVIRSSARKRKIVFLDELPWMDTPKSNFVSALEFFWNGWASSRDDVVLVVCGSATSWILSKLLKSRGGLHNRVTEQIWVRPFRLKECEAYARELGLVMSRTELAEAYMALGGIPFYWSLLRGEMSLAQNMDALFFAEDAKLRLEFSQLYASLFKHPEPYVGIVSALGKRGVGLAREQIAKVCGLPESGRLTRYLDELEQCGFIRRYLPYGAKKKGFVCQLVDNYTLFYFRFIRENAHQDRNFWTSSQGRPRHRVWAGLAFERLCLNHVDEIRNALGIRGVLNNVCAWHGRNAQIDLLLDRDDGVIDICEMKYVEGEYAPEKNDESALIRKRTSFVSETNCRKAVHLVLVTTRGLAKTKYRGVFQNTVTLDNLFS